MLLKQIIGIGKVNVVHGAWSGDKLKSKDFPLSRKRGKAYPLTRQWRWRVSTLQINGRRFRLITSYHLQAPEFAAVLGEEVGEDCRVIARYEFHGSHDGWHVHSYCGDFDKVPTGIVKPVGTIRIPPEGAFHRHCEMLNSGSSMNDHTAAAIAADIFGLGDTIDMFSMEGIPWKT